MFYYRDTDGSYVGAFDQPQSGLVECPPPGDGRQVWDDAAGAWGDLPPQVTTLYAVDLWKRTTDHEADQIEAAMALQSARVRNVFRAANSYRSDDEFWALLSSTAEMLFGAGRAAEILAPST